VKVAFFRLMVLMTIIKTTDYYSNRYNGKWISCFSYVRDHWQGDGYVDNTGGQGQTYFLSFRICANEKISSIYILTGAPQCMQLLGPMIKDFLG